MRAFMEPRQSWCRNWLSALSVVVIREMARRKYGGVTLSPLRTPDCQVDHSLSDNPTTTATALAVPVCTLLPAGTALFTKQRRASPDDGL